MNTDPKKDLSDPNKMNAPGQPNNQDPYKKPNSPPEHPQQPKGPNIFNILLIIFLVITFANLLFGGRASRNIPEVSYSQFLNLVDSEAIESVVMSEQEIQFSISGKADAEAVKQILLPKTDEKSDEKAEEALKNLDAKSMKDIPFMVVRVEDPDLVARLSKHNVQFSQVYVDESGSPFMNFLLTFIVPTVLIYLVYFFFIRRMLRKINQNAAGAGGGMFGVGKSKAKEYDVEAKTGVSFADVAGQDEAKESLMEMVDYLHNPQKYQEIGAKQPKGALLVGPPGTGKTMLAKAVAGEAKVPFYSISGSEFVEMFVGVGASRVRDLFEQANKNAPCIIFIDEIDAIGKSRDNQMVSNDEREQTLNQLLAEMDGFDSSKGIVVLAATNRPEVLDKALLRPGRFDRRIVVEKPDLIGREAILQVHAKKVRLDSGVSLHAIALATSGATGADLANMVNEAALLAVRQGRQTVAQADFMEAVEVVIAGKEMKDRVMNPTERKTVAYHEVGHALVSALQKNSQPVQKITIVPRTMGSLGYTMNMPEEDRYLMTRDEILAQIATLLGGRAAEILQFGQVTTGASNDIERATQLARSMVTQYGMSETFGPMGIESVQNRYLSGQAVSNVSPETEKQVDDEIRKILLECQANAINLLKENMEPLNRISEFLLEKENITGEEFMNLLHDNEQEA